MTLSYHEKGIAEMNLPVAIYTDGACSGNPGPGGWACVLIAGTRRRRISGYESHTTNNRMELTGVLRGLQALTRPVSVVITTDSQYVKKAFTDGWLESWIAKGWKTRSGEPVKNQDLWLELNLLRRKHDISWRWVKGHSGDFYNEMCDTLAQTAIRNLQGIDEFFI